MVDQDTVNDVDDTIGDNVMSTTLFSTAVSGGESTSFLH
jgi:hypothetical protein